MLVYVLQRLLRVLLSLVAVSIITFGMLQAVPGSFAELQDMQLGSGLGGDSQSAVTGEFAQRYGEEVPAWRTYLLFMQGAFTGDMGPSYKYPQLTVEEIIIEAFPVSLSLAIPAMILAVLVAIPVGILAAVRKDTVADYGSMFTLTTATALPNYLAALVLVLIAASWWDLLPTGGWSGPEYLVVPVMALAVQPTAELARYVRSSVLESLREEYVVAAYAKGGRRSTVLARHVLRNSLIPLVTVAGPMLARLATGTVFVESLMGIPGLGRAFVEAARTRDMPLLMGTTLFFALIIMLLNFIVDIAYGYLDPRIRHARSNPERRGLAQVARKRRLPLRAGRSRGGAPPGTTDSASAGSSDADSMGSTSAGSGVRR